MQTTTTAGGNSHPTPPARTPLIKELTVQGSSNFVSARPVPNNATCKISGTLYFEQGAPRSMSSTRKPDPSNPGQVTWSLNLDPSPVGAKWDVKCTAPDASQPGGVWVGQGSADFTPSSPATSSR